MKVRLLFLLLFLGLTPLYGQEFNPCLTGAQGNTSCFIKPIMDYAESAAKADTTYSPFYWHEPHIGLQVEWDSAAHRVDVMFDAVVKLNKEDSLMYSEATMKAISLITEILTRRARMQLPKLNGMPIEQLQEGVTQIMSDECWNVLMDIYRFRWKTNDGKMSQKADKWMEILAMQLEDLKAYSDHHVWLSYTPN